VHTNVLLTLLQSTEKFSFGRCSSTCSNSRKESQINKRKEGQKHKTELYQ